MSAKGPEVERFRQTKAFRASFGGISKKGTYETDEREYRSLDWALLPPPAATPRSSRRYCHWRRVAITARKRGGSGRIWP